MSAPLQELHEARMERAQEAVRQQVLLATGRQLARQEAERVVSEVLWEYYQIDIGSGQWTV